jgi:general secretion pathway protein C
MFKAPRNGLAARWYTRLGAPQAVSAVLTILIALDIGMAGHRLWPRRPAQATALPRIATHNPHSIDLQAVVHAHLFGVDKALAAHPAAIELATTLSLEGTISTDDPARGMAIISDGGRSKVYRVGELVQGSSLHEVYLEHVTLDRDGELMLIRLRKPLSHAVARASSPPSVAMQESTLAQYTDNLGRFLGHAPPAWDKVMRTLDVSDKSGALHGFRVYPVADGAPLSATGLMPGDVILAINGQPLTDMAKGRALLDGLDPSGGGQVTVERQNRRMDIALNPTSIPGAAN